MLTPEEIGVLGGGLIFFFIAWIALAALGRSD